MITLKNVEHKDWGSLKPLIVELERVVICLRSTALRHRQQDQQNQDALEDFIISEDEVDSILSENSSINREGTEGYGTSPIKARLSQLECEISKKRAQYACCDALSRLDRLADTFCLNQFERDIILLGLLPEVDLRHQKLFAYLNNDINRKIPTVDIALQCFQNTFDEEITGRWAFSSDSTLITNHLIQMEEDSLASLRPLLARGFKTDERVVSHLLGSDSVDALLLAHTRLIEPAVTLDELMLDEEQKSAIRQLSSQLYRNSPIFIYLEGPQGIGKKTVAQALCQTLSISVLVVDVENLLAVDGSLDYLVDLAFRESGLQDSAILWDHFDHLLTEERSNRILRNKIMRQAQIHGRPVFATGITEWQSNDMPQSLQFLRVPLDIPSYAVRQRVWQVCLNGHDSDISGSDLDEITDKFCLTPGQTREAVLWARNQKTLRGETRLSLHDLYAACRATSNHRLRNLMQRVQTRFTLEDIILPRDQMAQLSEIIGCAQYRHTVYEDWNFTQKTTLGKGLNVLFTGPSGTGKTMAASIVANELGLDMYKTDLSSIVSKYIGETEKNLDRMFTEARNSNSILFFDEADALFGKRSEVRDSHDRYANIETAYLLQKMEEYDGTAILATNLGKNLDDAFKRRMQFSIEFPMPEEADRHRIWQHVFPAEAPLAADVDLLFMARQFSLSGGSIRNIALASAFLAASDDGCITMRHLVLATRREYQKIGRLCTESDFAAYFDMVKG